uniref:Transposase (Putative), gypsy type n=1 Tax=Tanacetum cinerariifolium TaxID=118510 RepID=A0A6L2MG59_TANCI|nr:hypothetical protein [Tanacetum cinerariifolium]
MVRDSVQLETVVNTISYEYLLDFTSEYGIPEMLHPELPGPGDRIVDFPEGKVGVYTSKRLGKNTPQCYTKPLDSLKNWNNRFFWVEERVFPTVVDWQTNAHKDGMLAACTYSVEAVRALDTHRTPIQKQPEMLLCLVGISSRYYLGDEVYPTFLHVNDRGGLIRAPNPTKVKVGSRPRAPHEVPLLTLTANHVIEMDDPATATDSSGVPPTIERSPLDFSLEAGASDRGTTTSEVSPSGDVPAAAAPKPSQVEVDAADPPTATKSRKRGHDGSDANAPPKSLRRDHADPRPSGSSHGGKSLAAIQMGLASTASMPEDVPTSVSDPDPLFFADPPARPSADVAQSSLGIAAAGDPESKNVSSPAEEIKNLEALLETEAGMKKAAKDRSAGLNQELENMRAQFSDLQRCGEMDARLDALSIDFDEELYPHMLTTMAGRRWVIGRGLRLAVMKSLESIEAYDPEAEAKFFAALQALKDLKYPLLDQLEGLRDAPMDVIMAALYLECDTGGDAPQRIRDLRPCSSQLTLPVYPEVRDPRNPWACKEEIRLADAIAANISRAEKKKRSRIVCRTHGVGSAHHARSDGVPVSEPTVVLQGLALLLVDVATQTESNCT